MKYRITVDVDGETIADKDFSTQFGDYTIGVKVNEAHVVNKFYIEKKVSEDEKLPTVEPGDGEVKHIFSFPPPSVRNELVEKLIYFESVGAFWWHIRAFALKEAYEEWVPENDEERKRLSIIGFSTKGGYARSPRPIHDHQIQSLLELEDDEKAMTTPLAFYREGSVNFESHRYINAFQSFFLMIEGLYAQGKSGNSAMIKALDSSADLKKVAKKMLEGIIKDPDSNHYKTLTAELNSLGLPLDEHGVIEWLVRTRGQLSHFSIKSTAKQGNPHKQYEYRTHAYIASGICTLLYADFHKGVLDKRGYTK